MLFDAVSIQEEQEDGFMEKAVVLDTENIKKIAKLPCVVDQDTRLVQNEDVALRVLNRQVKLLNQKP